MRVRPCLVKTFLIVLVIVVSTGCRFVDLKQQVTAIANYTLISGFVQPLNESDTPIIVVLFSNKPDEQNVVDMTVARDGQFYFWSPPGTYYLAAFHDLNGDYDYQSNESGGYFGAPDAVVVDSSSINPPIQIILEPFSSFVYRGYSPSVSTNSQPENTRLWPGIINIGKVLKLTDDQFSAANAQMSLWQPLKFSLEIGPGVYFLHPYDTKKVPILFVHGIGGTPRDWQYIVNGLNMEPRFNS